MALREIIARFGFQLDSTGLKKAERGIAGVIGQMRTFGAVIAGTQVVRGIANFVNEMVDAGDALGKTSVQLGLSIAELQRWQSAAGFAGVEATQFNQSMRVLQKNVVLAGQGSKQAGDAFKKLGVDIKDSNGVLKTGDAIMRDVGVALGSLENSTERVALAQILMGRTGAQLLPLFKDGEKGLAALQKRFEEFGGPVGADFVKFAEDAKDAFQDFDTASRSLKSRLAVAILPTLNRVVIGLARIVTAFSRATEGTEILRSALIALGLVLAKAAIAKFGASLVSLARAAALPLAKFILLALVIDDLIALFEGRGSAIGAIINKIFGTGAAEKFVQSVKNVGSAFLELASTGDFKTFSDRLDAVFGPPGQAIVESIIEAFDAVALAIGEFLVESTLSLGRAISDFGSAAVVLGDAIVDGIIDTIVDSPARMGAALGKAAQSAIARAKAFISASSPSKLAGDEIGAPIVEGVVGRIQEMSRLASQQSARALVVAGGLERGNTISAPSNNRGSTGIQGGVIFKSDINLVVQGGSVSDPQIQKLRQGVRSDLTDNRRATLDALRQVIEVA